MALYKQVPEVQNHRKLAKDKMSKNVVQTPSFGPNRRRQHLKVANLFQQLVSKTETLSVSVKHFQFLFCRSCFWLSYFCYFSLTVAFHNPFFLFGFINNSKCSIWSRVVQTGSGCSKIQTSYLTFAL